MGGIGYAAYLYIKAEHVAQAAYKELDRGSKSSKRLEAVKPLEDNISILIMGVDESEARKKRIQKILEVLSEQMHYF
ncbi:hypothetical protein GCM10020331_038000 [Ectobacillus funiculus]